MKKSVSKSLMAGIIALAGTIALTGCVTPPPPPEPYQITSSFNAEKAAQMLRPGTGTIKGSGLLRQAGGGVVTCAGNNILLVPVTKYSTERIRAIYGNSIKGYSPATFTRILSSVVPNYRRLSKIVQCDAQGFFKFDGLSDAEFYVITSITWEIFVTDKYSRIEGGWLMQRVSVKPGEVKEIVLTL